MGFGVQGFAFRVQGSGFRVWGIGFRVEGVACNLRRSWGTASPKPCRVSSFEFGCVGFGHLDESRGFKAFTSQETEKDPPAHGIPKSQAPRSLTP